MAKLSQIQCRSIVFRYFLTEGWLPAGTNEDNWGDVTVRDLELDDPPLPGNPDLQKGRAALDVQNLFHILGSKIPSPLGRLREPALTLRDFADWCRAEQIE